MKMVSAHAVGLGRIKLSSNGGLYHSSVRFSAILFPLDVKENRYATNDVFGVSCGFELVIGVMRRRKRFAGGQKSAVYE